MLLPTWIELKSSSLDVPSSSTGRLLWRSMALHKAYGHKAKCTALGQQAWAWNSCLLALSERLQMACLAMPFWKCALTPQKVSFCHVSWHACWKALTWNPRLEIPILVPISGTPIGSGILIPFQILGILVRFFFWIPLLKSHQTRVPICKIWNSINFSCRNSVHLILYIYQGQHQKTLAVSFPAKITSTCFTWKTSRCNFGRQYNHATKFTSTQNK